jgi:hypothetical protein
MRWCAKGVEHRSSNILRLQDRILAVFFVRHIFGYATSYTDLSPDESRADALAINLSK